MAGIYLHIPFCKQACHYCDFHFSTSAKYKDEMVQALLKEIGLQSRYLGNETIETIYFGGGTPSVLLADEIQLLINTITEHHTVTADAEITLEANPDDLDQPKLKALRQTPVNRFSIGVQSFFDEDLAWMNRAHRSSEAEGAVKRAQDIGFENITVDLIYGYPLLSNVKWKHNLHTVFDLGIPHISAYAMTVEPQTALASFISKHKQPAMSEEQSAAQFTMMLNEMESAGFEQYEISNFCRPGQYSRHNSNYWRGVKYLGIGPSAHSFNGDTRQWNVANNTRYIKSVFENTIPAEVEVLTQENRLNEYIMTALRTKWGISLDKLEAIAGGSAIELQKAASRYLDDGSITQTGQTLNLTARGKLYADNIASELFF